jgi:hypothetical protein
VSLIEALAVAERYRGLKAEEGGGSKCDTDPKWLLAK